ncbi:MAG: anhydro-N-acetylmuramic acid kinase [Woeseiaceae bacterium]|nr:anhydro-N-acetylmuramic acid kinase [Woeseiaceae bacterium]
MSPLLHDYKTSSAPPARKVQAGQWFAVGLGLPLLTLAGVLTVREPAPASADAAAEATAAAPAGFDAVLQQAYASTTPFVLFARPAASGSVELHPPMVWPDEPRYDVLRHTIRRGDTLERVFRRSNLNLGDLARIVSLPDAAEPLRMLRPGDSVEIRHQDGRLVSLERELSLTESLRISRADDGFAVERLDRPVETRRKRAYGRINTSLFESAAAAGLPDKLIMNLAGIFAWDIDFVLDIRASDDYYILYEEIWQDGEFVTTGEIVAAEFNNNGRTFRAIRFIDDEGRSDYFTPDGLSVRKAFIRAPCRLHSYQLKLQSAPPAPDSQYDPRPQGRRLRRAARHADQGSRRRQGNIPRPQGRLRERRDPAARRQHHDALRAHERLREGRPGRPPRPAGADHRLRRQHRPRHGCAPALRVSPERRAPQPAHRPVAPGGPDTRRVPVPIPRRGRTDPRRTATVQAHPDRGRRHRVTPMNAAAGPDRERHRLCIGLISGTSIDGIDSVLAKLGDRRCSVVGSLAFPYDEALQADLLRASRKPATCDADEVGRLDRRVGLAFRDAALELLRTTGTNPADVAVIGSHGQTLRHQPAGEWPFTLQLGDPNVIAAGTGITTVADFRRRDMALGGEGAPLAPAFHQWLFADEQQVRVVLNIGGFANITVLVPGQDAVPGFDTGPGNTLLDAWARRHLERPYDDGGAWAAGGKVLPALLARLLDDDYFRRSPPKSTGFEYFNETWLDRRLAPDDTAAAADVQATLCELSAQTIAQAVGAHAPGADEVVVCGGGAANRFLMERLARHLGDVTLRTTEHYGIGPDWIEAAASRLARHPLPGPPAGQPAVGNRRQRACDPGRHLFRRPG